MPIETTRGTNYCIAVLSNNWIRQKTIIKVTIPYKRPENWRIKLIFRVLKWKHLGRFSKTSFPRQIRPPYARHPHSSSPIKKKIGIAYYANRPQEARRALPHMRRRRRLHTYSRGAPTERVRVSIVWRVGIVRRRCICARMRYARVCVFVCVRVRSCMCASNVIDGGGGTAKTTKKTYAMRSCRRTTVARLSNTGVGPTSIDTDATA